MTHSYKSISKEHVCSVGVKSVLTDVTEKWMPDLTLYGGVQTESAQVEWVDNTEFNSSCGYSCSL